MQIINRTQCANSQYSPYNNWAEEMYLAKAIKYAISREPLGDKDTLIGKSISLENMAEIENQKEMRLENQKDSVKSNLESLLDLNFKKKKHLTKLKHCVITLSNLK